MHFRTTTGGDGIQKVVKKRKKKTEKPLRIVLAKVLAEQFKVDEDIRKRGGINNFDEQRAMALRKFQREKKRALRRYCR